MSDTLRFNCLKASLVAIFMLFLQVGFSQKSKQVLTNLPALAKAVEDRKNLLGKDFSVVVATADSIVFAKNSGDEANPKTPYAIGASSQWLTTALILQLADEGKVSLDAPVSQYLPIFELYRRNYVTLRHCLTHQTGLTSDAPKTSAVLDPKKYSSLEDAVADMLKKEIHANAGEAFRYNNNGFIIAARVAEAVTKKRFDQLIRTLLFVPLGMRNTSFSTDDGSAPNPSSGAKSTVADYTKFLQMLLNKGKAGDKQLLSETAVAEMRKVQIAASATGTVPKAVAGLSYTLGAWTVDSEEDRMATTLVTPSLTGTWPLVDFARGYAFLVFARGFSGEQQPALYQQLKNEIDPRFAGGNK